MPDPSRATVSASQIPAVFDRSTYCTKWMLFQHFANGMPIEPDENERMDWGKRLEPAILKGAADQIRCDIIPHPQTDYLRHPDGLIGCTPDGYAFDPQRGLGFIEAKNIDWKRWRDTWTDTAATAAIELQHQTQLAIPHPEHGMPKWGMIAALVGGNDLLLYPREPLPAVHDAIRAEAAAFLGDVKARREPPVLGRAIELEGLAWAYPGVDATKILTDDDFPDPAQRLEIARLIEEYHDVKARKSVAEAIEKELKARLQALAGDAAEIMVHRRLLKITKSPIDGRTQQVKAHIRVVMKPTILDYSTPIAELTEALQPEVPRDILV